MEGFLLLFPVGRSGWTSGECVIHAWTRRSWASVLALGEASRGHREVG